MGKLSSAEMEQLVDQLANYICSLPNGRKLNLEKAVMAVCPESTIDLICWIAAYYGPLRKSKPNRHHHGSDNE